MEYDRDTVYLAHSYPYTYTDLQKYLNAFQADVRRKEFMKRDLLCHTVAGNRCDVLTVTDFNSP